MQTQGVLKEPFVIQPILSTAVTEPPPPKAALPQSDATDLQDPTLNLPGADIWFHTPRAAGKRGAGWLVTWLTLLSLGVHGLLLVLPVAPEKPATPPPEQEKSARITQLSPPGPKGNTKPKPKAATAKPVPKPRTSNRPPAVPPIPPVKPPPAPTPAAAAPAATPTTTPAATEPMAGNPWEDFPQYPQAQPGCYNLDSCRQTPQPLEQVSTFFSQQLPAKKYAAQLTIDEPGRKVYQVSKNGLSQFLNLLAVEGKGTVYVVASTPLALGDLAGAIEVPAAVQAVLGNLAAEDGSRDLFAQPDAFFLGSDLRPEVASVQLVRGEAADTFFDVYFRNNLFNNGFSSSDNPDSYGGGQIYQIKKEDLTLYINLVPTVDGTSTLVVVLKEMPQ